MRQFVMTVVERRERFSEGFTTQPCESAWATEAIFFVRVEELGDSATLTATVQISADGVRWIDEGTKLAPVSSTGDYFVRVSHFGGWLRLRGEIVGEAPMASLTVQLALKE